LEAIQKTEEAKPDLILFDIGLPKLSGIEAARRLRQLGCTARILFISQESSPEVIQEALGLGVLGMSISCALKAIYYGYRRGSRR
jgi:DNA-binding NarL/FixJ family response regulator